MLFLDIHKNMEIHQSFWLLTNGKGENKNRLCSLESKDWQNFHP